jgi:cytochrome P450
LVQGQVYDAGVTDTGAIDVYYDPFDFEIDDDPYPAWMRLRDEVPLYYNDKYGFYALSRYADVARALPDWETYRSGKGTTLDIILNGIDVPPGVILFEDPPLHDLHRRLLSKVFTPRRTEAIESLARKFCAQVLDPLIGSGRFDFIADLGAWVPMRAIGYLLGIPEQDQVAIRKNTDHLLELSDGKALREVPSDLFEKSYQMLVDYIDWRAEHPSDDLMTQLLNAEIEEADGTRRGLSRAEVLNYTGTIAGAGNETTTRLIGFLGQLLSDHPDQRRQIVADSSLIPRAIEEVLRYEAPSPVQARYVAREAECYGQTVPDGSVMLLLNGSANRDDRQFDDPNRFDIHRNPAHLSFGQGLHFCLGSALARMEARVALEEVIKRWPDWEVDYDNAAKAHTASVRGWARLPVTLG